MARGEVAIDYAPESDPTFRARLQEMFGLAETPRIADGRAKLRIELLSPAGRTLALYSRRPQPLCWRRKCSY